MVLDVRVRRCHIQAVASRSNRFEIACSTTLLPKAPRHSPNCHCKNTQATSQNFSEWAVGALPRLVLPEATEGPAAGFSNLRTGCSVASESCCSNPSKSLASVKSLQAGKWLHDSRFRHSWAVDLCIGIRHHGMSPVFGQQPHLIPQVGRHRTRSNGSKWIAAAGGSEFAAEGFEAEKLIGVQRAAILMQTETGVVPDEVQDARCSIPSQCHSNHTSGPEEHCLQRTEQENTRVLPRLRKSRISKISGSS